MNWKEQFLKEGYKILKGPLDVLKQTVIEGESVITRFKIFDDLGNFRNVVRRSRKNQSSWVITKPDGTNVGVDIHPHTLHITKSSPHFLGEEKYVFLSSDCKNVDYIQERWGNRYRTRDFYRGELTDSNNPNVVNNLKPMPWVSLGHLKLK